MQKDCSAVDITFEYQLEYQLAALSELKNNYFSHKIYKNFFSITNTKLNTINKRNFIYGLIQKIFNIFNT
jgi:hypothetical protein